jgi:hypothetical protein
MRVADYFFRSEGSEVGCEDKDATGCVAQPLVVASLRQSLAE